MAARTLIALEALGAVFMIAVGSAMHFVYGWSGEWLPVALFAAVNESVWEHLKLGFWPGLLWALGLALFLPFRAARILSAKGYALLLTAVMIVSIFLTYTSILGRNVLVLDIATFVVAVIAGQTASAFLILRNGETPLVAHTGMVLLIVQITAYALLTYFAPNLWLFIDPRTGAAGIPG